MDTIGIVVPGLARHRKRIEHIMENVLHAPHLLSTETDCERAFNISLGEPLADVPVVRDALAVITLCQGRIPVTEISHLLHSPYIRGAAEETQTRALIDTYLVRDMSGKITLNYFLSRYGDAPDELSAGNFVSALRALHKALPTDSKRHDLHYWAQFFSRCLKIMGWPGERTVSSHEYQSIQAFHKLLDSYTALNPVTGDIHMSRAVSLLRKMTQERIFQPEAPTAPVQIMGMLEASGMPFSHLWITDLDDNTWPSVPHPNPFLPLSLQRQLNMPHATARREMDYARAVLDALIHSADMVTVSHVIVDKARVLRPSPLVKSIPLSECALQGGQTPVGIAAQMNQQPAVLLQKVDETAPAVTQYDIRSGGAALFRDQAACPFRAFAVHRLRAHALEQADPGLDTRDRGNIVHQVLETVWNHLGSQQALQNLDENERSNLVADHVEKALQDYRRRKPHVLRSRFLELEKQRLTGLIGDWLAVELQRQPFKVIEQEKTMQAELMGLRFHLRPDRVDKTQDGRLVMIDYKTGKVKTSHWFTERPEAPQLPVYSRCYAGSVSALVFARVEKGKLGYAGVAEDDFLIPGLEIPGGKCRTAELKPFSSWDEVNAAWQRIIESLAKEHLSGDARVMPKVPQNTCRYCDVKPLCRIHEQEQL